MPNSPRVLLTMIKLMQRHSKFQYHIGRPYWSGGQGNAPEYNYGLAGKGKPYRIDWKKKSNLQITTEGEVLFGVHPVTLALSSHHRQHLYTVFIDKKHEQRQISHTLQHIQDLASQRKVPVQFVPKSMLTHLAGNRPHQGVCLDATSRFLPHCDLQSFMQGPDFNSSVLWLMLYNVQDPMNFGAILRSSYFLGVDRVIVPSINSCALSPVVSKASAGALEVMDICQIEGNYRSLQQLTQVWKSCGGQVVGTASLADTGRQVNKLQDFTATSPLLLIVGNEGSGVDEDVLDLCDSLLTIPAPSDRLHPLVGQDVTSLNVSVATGILIHWLQASRQRS